MGTKYTSQSATGYNSSPPPDDGSTVASNKVTWATIKTKLPDPIKALADAINGQLVTTLDVSVTAQSVNYTTLATDHQKPILCTSTITISLGDANAMGSGYQVTVVNAGSGVITVTPITGANTLNGTAGGSVLIPPQQCLSFEVNSNPTPDGYNIISGSVVATQADQETATNAARMVTPLLQPFHPSASKAWLRYNGVTTSVVQAYNVASVTYNALGDYTVNLTNGLANADGCALVSGASANGSINVCIPTTINTDVAAGTIRILMTATGAGTGTINDSPYVCMDLKGDR